MRCVLSNAEQIWNPSGKIWRPFCLYQAALVFFLGGWVRTSSFIWFYSCMHQICVKSNLSFTCIPFQEYLNEWLCILSLGSVLDWFSCSACLEYTPRWWRTWRSSCQTCTMSWKHRVGSTRTSERTSTTMMNFRSRIFHRFVASLSHIARQTCSLPPCWLWRWWHRALNTVETCPMETFGHIQTLTLMPFIRLQMIITGNLNLNIMFESNVTHFDVWQQENHSKSIPPSIF